MYTLPQEIEVWYIIPAIRRELARCFVKDHKITYKEVGEMLGLTKASISQYLAGKRASKIKLHKKALKEVCKSCELLVAKKRYTNIEIIRILKFIRDENLPCEVCDKKTQGVLEDCKEIRLRDIDLKLGMPMHK